MYRLGTRNIALLIIATALISTVLIFKTDGYPERVFAKNNTLIAESVQKNRDTDTDADGVPDWQELLKGTNPNNPNTFNTEGGDAAYIDALQANKNATQSETATSTDNNVTDQLARGVLGEYLLLKSGEHDTGYASPDELAQFLFEKASKAIRPSFLQKTDFTIVNSDKSALLLYADRLNYIDNKYPDTSTSIVQSISESLHLTEAMSLDTEYDVARINSYQLIYQDVYTELKQIPVPDIVVNEHVNLTNSVKGVVDSLENIKLIGTDSVRAVLGVQALSQYESTMHITYTLILNKLEAEHISL